MGSEGAVGTISEPAEAAKVTVGEGSAEAEGGCGKTGGSSAAMGSAGEESGGTIAPSDRTDWTSGRSFLAPPNLVGL